MGNDISVIQDLFPHVDPTLLELIHLNRLCSPDSVPLPASRRYNRRLRRRRLQFFKHADECIRDNTFHRKYRMSFRAFLLLVKTLSPALERDPRKCRYGSPIFPDLIVAIGIRFMTGVPQGALADIYRVSQAEVYKCRDCFIDAVLSNPSLAIRFPSSHVEWEEVRSGFEEKSYNGLFHGTCGAIDGFFQPTAQPTRKETKGNVLAYFSGHYKSHGLNCQAACDIKLRFMYFGVVAPGKTNDCIAYELASDMKQCIDSLPLGLFFVGDAAYTLSEHLLTPFTGSNREDLNRDAYNFYLSQMRIRIEMAFGRLTNKFRILRSKLQGTLATNARVLLCCATLHNFCIDQEELGSEDDGTAASSSPLEQSNDFVIRAAPDGLAYLPTVDDEDEAAALLRTNLGYSHAQQSILERINREGTRRPLRNIMRNTIE
jgi:hypothetical protein